MAAGRQVAVVPNIETTVRLTKRLAPRAKDAGIAIALVDEFGQVVDIAPEQDKSPVRSKPGGVTNEQRANMNVSTQSVVPRGAEGAKESDGVRLSPPDLISKRRCSTLALHSNTHSSPPILLIALQVGMWIVT